MNITTIKINRNIPSGLLASIVIFLPSLIIISGMRQPGFEPGSEPLQHSENSSQEYGKVRS